MTKGNSSIIGARWTMASCGEEIPVDHGMSVRRASAMHSSKGISGRGSFAVMACAASGTAPEDNSAATRKTNIGFRANMGGHVGK